VTSLKNDIRDVVDLLNNPEWNEMEDDKLKAQVAVAEVTEAACAILKGLGANEADARIYEIIEAAEKLYDEYYAKLKIHPGDFIEDYPEKVAFPGISDGVMRYFNFLY